LLKLLQSTIFEVVYFEISFSTFTTANFEVLRMSYYIFLMGINTTAIPNLNQPESQKNE